MDLLPPIVEEEVVLVIELELDMVSVVSRGCDSKAVMFWYGVSPSCDDTYRDSKIVRDIYIFLLVYSKDSVERYQPYHLPVASSRMLIYLEA